MTALCGGGTSSPKPPLTNPYVVFTVDKLVNLVATGGFEWLEQWVPGASDLTFHLPTFCATDPPPMPNFTPDRVASWVISPTGAAILRSDMNALISNLLWPTVCQCDSGPQPPPPTPVPQPPGVTVNPPQLLTPTGTPCGSPNDVGTAASFDASGSFVYDNINWFVIPQTTQWASYSVNVSGTGATNAYPFDWQFDWKASQTGPVLGTTTYTQVHQDATFRATVLNTTVPAGATYPVIKVHSAASANLQFTVSVEVTPFCTAPGPDLTEPCCPPDPVTQQLLFSINSAVQQILQDLASPKLPFVDSTVHASLSGTGAVSISPAAAAVRVDIVSRPTPWPDNPGTPDFLFSIGFITPFAVGTPLRGSRLVYDHQTFQYPSYTDQIGYTLPGGVMINLVELVTAPPAA